MHEKEHQEPPEHTSEHVKSQNFLGACPQRPLTQSILWGLNFLYLPWGPNPLGGPDYMACLFHIGHKLYTLEMYAFLIR